MSLVIFWQIGVLQFDICPTGVAPTGRSLKQWQDDVEEFNFLILKRF